MNALGTIERYDEKMAALWAYCCEWNDTVPEGSAVVVDGAAPSFTAGPASVLPSGQIGVMLDGYPDYVPIDKLRIIDGE